jgi:hypothetical protein
MVDVEVSPGERRQQIKANANRMATHLKTYGWQDITVDMEWFVIDPKPEGNAKDSHLSNSSFSPTTCMGWA